MKLVLRVFAVLVALAAAIWFASSPDVESEAASATPAATTSEFEDAAPNFELVNEDPAATPIVADREPTRAPTPSAALLEPPTLSTEHLARLDVRVRSRDNGAGVPNHRVTAFVASTNSIRNGKPAALSWNGKPAAGSIAMPGESARTDEAGRATLYVAPHIQHVVASLDMFQEAYRRRAAPLDALRSVELELAVPTEPDIVFRGRVVDAAGGAPIAGARVRVVERPSSALFTDVFGAFEFRGRSWTEERVRVELEPYLPLTTPLVSGHETAERAFEVRLSRPAALELLVLNHDGRPARATVVVSRACEQPDARDAIGRSAREWTQSSGSSGIASFRALPASVPLEMRIQSELGPDCGPKPVFLTAGETTSLEWRLPPTGTIRGRVVDASGVSLANCVVELEHVGEPRLETLVNHFVDSGKTARSRDDGFFEFRGVPVGRWQVELLGHRSDDEGESLVARFARVEIDAQHLLHEIEIRLEVGTYISGRVLTHLGKPARTNVVAVHSDERFSAAAPSNAEGEFRVGPLPEGDYTLRAFGSGAQGAISEPVQAVTGGEDVQLRLTPGSFLSGGPLLVRLVSLSGEPVDGVVYVQIPNLNRPAFDETERGECEFDALPVGRVTVHAMTSTGALAQLEVEVLEGPTPTVVELVMRPATRADDR
jgi:hypothetical protein